MTNPEPTCGSCRYYNPKRGFCQLNPPVVQDARHAVFPRTFWDDWCGQWKAQPYAQAEAPEDPS